MCRETNFETWFADNRSDCSLYEEYRGYCELLDDIEEDHLDFKAWAEIYFESMDD